MDAYKEQFLSGVEGASRAAVKRLTRAIESELLEATINAPDWYVTSLYKATYVTVSQGHSLRRQNGSRLDVGE